MEAPDLGPLLVPSHRSLEVIGRLIHGQRSAILRDRVLATWVAVEPRRHHSGKARMNIDLAGGEAQGLVPLLFPNSDSRVRQVPVVQLDLTISDLRQPVKATNANIGYTKGLVALPAMKSRNSDSSADVSTAFPKACPGHPGSSHPD